MSPHPMTNFDSLDAVAERLGIEDNIITFEHPSVDEPYEGLIVNDYIECHTNKGHVGVIAGQYLLKGKRGLFVADPADPKNAWKPVTIEVEDAEAEPEDEAETEPEPEATEPEATEPDPPVVAAEDLPEVPEDSEFFLWNMKDLRSALVEEGLGVKGKRPALLKRLHWNTHGVPSDEDE